MRKKIYFSLVLTSLISVFLSTIFLSTFFYDFYIDMSKKNLENITEVYMSSNDKKDINLSNNVSIKLYENPPKDKQAIYLDTPYEGLTLRVSKPRESIGHILIPSLILSSGLIMMIVLFLNILTSKIIDKLYHNINLVNNSIGNILNSSVVDVDLMDYEFQSFAANINLYKEQADYYINLLKKNEKFRREFTANVSHELKTPLTSINGYAEMIEHNMVKGEDLTNIGHVIHSEGKRLLELIDSIIELSNLENPNLKVEFTSTNIYEIIESTVGKLETRLAEKDINLSLKGRDYFINGNQRMLKDLIFNLLDNAIKYNKVGGTIDINLFEEENYIVFVLEDTGIGISEDNLARVFERFYIVDKSRSSSLNSTGLGLSIVKHIVEAHRGEISISSKLDIGTRITIKFKI